TFLLKRFLSGYRPFRKEYDFLFNSYYEAAGPRHARPRRGMLTRPSCDEVADYRVAIDEAMSQLLRDLPDEAAPLFELGVQHEAQHQELLLTDILHAFSQNPLRPTYDSSWRAPAASAADGWLEGIPGVVEIGHGGSDFAFVNETGRH